MQRIRLRLTLLCHLEHGHLVVQVVLALFLALLGRYELLLKTQLRLVDHHRFLDVVSIPVLFTALVHGFGNLVLQVPGEILLHDCILGGRSLGDLARSGCLRVVLVFGDAVGLIVSFHGFV